LSRAGFLVFRRATNGPRHVTCSGWTC